MPSYTVKIAPVIGGETMQHTIDHPFWQHKLIHAHNSPTRKLEGIFLKVQTQVEVLPSAVGVGASFPKNADQCAQRLGSKKSAPPYSRL